MSLVDRYGREIRANRPIRDEIAVASVRSDFSSYAADGLTPGGLAALLREADAGNVTRQADLFESIEERDAHLASVLQTRRLGVSSLPWTVHPASDAARDVDVAAAVRTALERTAPDASRHDYDDLSFADAALDVLDAIGKGFSVCEIMWDSSMGQHVPDKILYRHPRQFTFWGGGQKVLTVPRLLTDAEPTLGEELIPRKFIYHRARSRSGFAARGGVLRPCVWLYLFKNYSIKDWVIFAERYAMPLRVGTYPAGASEAEREVLERAVRYLGADAAAIMSEGLDIKFLGAEGKSVSSDIYAAMAQYCDAGMSKAVLGQTLTTEQTGGTYATGMIHQMVRDDIQRADARSLGECLTAQLVRPIVLFNYGPGTAVPRLEFTVEDEADYTANVERLKGAREIGLPVPAGQAYELLGLRPPKGGEAVLQDLSPASPVIAATSQHGYTPCSCGRTHEHAPAEVMAMKATALDPGEPDWFAEYMSALAPQLKGMTATAVDRVADYVRTLDAPPAIDEFSRAVSGLVASEFAKVDPAPIRKAVEDMYRWHRLTNKLAPTVEMAFGGADVRSMDALARFDRFYVSKFASNPGVESAIKAHFETEFFGPDARGLFGSDTGAIADLKARFTSTLGQLTDSQVQRIVDTSVMRTRNWGRVSQLHSAGIRELEVWEPRQDCAFCREMHARRISVPRAYNRIELMSAMEASEFESELKAWPTSEQGMLDDPGIIERAVAAGLAPPFHPHCFGHVRVVIA